MARLLVKWVLAMWVGGEGCDVASPVCEPPPVEPVFAHRSCRDGIVDGALALPGPEYSARLPLSPATWAVFH
jgi:hypothetical protein